jgi:hypothetical protein
MRCLHLKLNAAQSVREISRSTMDEVIKLPATWPKTRRVKYFIPEWNDQVDPDYDFLTDTHSGGRGDWSNQTYAHQMFSSPNYDGILISKVVAEQGKKKKQRINAMGVHRFLRVPRSFPIMGDCGAFGYINDDVPPYTTNEIIDYYTRLGFDYGVSLDHLIVKATMGQAQERYDLTIHNAEVFLREHQAGGYPWVPIGAVQGWDPASYAEAARQYVAMGYKYIALGGLIRSSTKNVLALLDAVHAVVPAGIGLHLFGLARISHMKQFSDYGVVSVDSASLLRRAWMGSDANYLTHEGKYYGAIRVPQATKSFRAKRMVQEGRATAEQVAALDQRCMQALRDYDKGRLSVESVLCALSEYDALRDAESTDAMRRTLEDKPWRRCPCEICRAVGIQVVIFRGNNRNRRRGFHNTYVFYRLLQRALAGEAISFSRSKG